MKKVTWLALVALMATPALAGYSTGFEAPAFAPGFIGIDPAGQDGWSSYITGSASSPLISTANPYSGSQHLRFEYDDTQDNGYWALAAFSPTAPVAGNYMAIMVNISAMDGADYFVQPQAAAEGFLTQGVHFGYEGEILVYEDDGAGGLLDVDTGVTWTPGVYKLLEVDLTDGVNVVTRYDGAVIHSTPIFAGTTIDEVFLGCDNYNYFNTPMDTGDFDNLVITPEPASLALLAFGGVAMLRRRR